MALVRQLTTANFSPISKYEYIVYRTPALKVLMEHLVAAKKFTDFCSKFSVMTYMNWILKTRTI